jgi:AMMECR1 domain-containing protein
MTNGKKKINQTLKKILVFIVGFFLIVLIYNLVLQWIPLSEGDGHILMEIAGSEIEGNTYTGRVTPRLSKRRPVFVSAYQDGERVACFGYTRALFPVHESVRYLAKGMNIDLEEDYDVAITVFNDYEEYDEGDETPLGSGVMVRRDGFEGVVLPLTFKEANLTKDEALDLAAQKAGFSQFSWDDFEVFTFDAQVFKSHNG